MTKAIHLLNRRDGSTYIGMTKNEGEPNTYRSCCWLLNDTQASELLGGWVYFHAVKADPSGFGGQIIGFEQGEGDMADRKVILFRADAGARGQTWRGADHGMAHMSGVVEANSAHEA